MSVVLCVVTDLQQILAGGLEHRVASLNEIRGILTERNVWLQAATFDRAIEESFVCFDGVSNREETVRRRVSLPSRRRTGGRFAKQTRSPVGNKPRRPAFSRANTT
jgi:hypothetical protein